MRTKELLPDVNAPDYLHFCNGCKLLKLNTEYRNYNKKRNIRKFASKCKECADIINQKYVDNNKEKVAKIKNKHYLTLSKEIIEKRHKEYVKNHYIKLMFQTLKHNAKVRNLCVEIDVSFIEELYEKQNHFCYYTGREMNLIKGDKERVVSVDRVDSSKGYTKENVVLCCQKVNIVKNDLSYQNFLILCEEVLKQSKLNIKDEKE